MRQVDFRHYYLSTCKTSLYFAIGSNHAIYIANTCTAQWPFMANDGLGPVFQPTEELQVVYVHNSNVYLAAVLPRCCCAVQWNLSWETTAMRDPLSWQTMHFRQNDLHFNITEPVTRDHLSWQTTFLWPMGWSFKTGSTVLGKKEGKSLSVILYKTRAKSNPCTWAS